MKNLVFLLVVLLGAPLFLMGCADEEKASTNGGKAGESTTSGDETSGDETSGDETEAKDIVDTAVAADDFNTLVAAVKAAELVDTLKGEGPFTVFAPTDAAFEALPEGTLDELLKPESKDKLVGILTYHVVSGKVMAKDVVELTSAKTVQGNEVKIVVEDGKVKVDNANVTSTDIECSNGVIHIIDAVILPE